MDIVELLVRHEFGWLGPNGEAVPAFVMGHLGALAQAGVHPEWCDRVAALAREATLLQEIFVDECREEGGHIPWHLHDSSADTHAQAEDLRLRGRLVAEGWIRFGSMERGGRLIEFEGGRSVLHARRRELMGTCEGIGAECRMSPSTIASALAHTEISRDEARAVAPEFVDGLSNPMGMRGTVDTFECMWRAVYDQISPEAFNTAFPELVTAQLMVKPVRWGSFSDRLTRVPETVIEIARRSWIPEPPAGLAEDGDDSPDQTGLRSGP